MNMKQTISFSLIIAMLLLSSCGTGTALIVNQNLNTTHVHLGSNNYKVVGDATGSCEVEYIMLIGGLNQRQVYQNAYSDMVSKANLESGSRALINVITEEHIGGVPPFYVKRKITVSANVIEFIK
jgi:hypothetical protein